MHAAVVGAGVFGVWTAHALMQDGARVTLVDAHGAGNSRASSGDESRIVRCGYGGDGIYSRMARAATAEWQALDARARRRGGRLWYGCGALWLPGAQDEYMQRTIETLRAEAIDVEVLDGGALRHRFPHLAAADVSHALFEPAAGAVAARRAVQALAAELIDNGVEFRLASARPFTTSGPAVRLWDGTALEADVAVYACGPWLPKLFPDLLGERIRPTRQVVVYFGPPAGDLRFGPDRTPAWIDFPSGIYGIPDLDGRGIKVGIDTHGPPFDPDTGERVLDPPSAGLARAWLARRLPALAAAPILESRICQYENTSSGDFLIDQHPDQPHVWLVGGGSGHGFKHGPAVGRYVADRLASRRPPEPRFTLAQKGTHAARGVY